MPQAACDGARLWVLDRGWHTELALRADAITGGLALFRELFPGARTLLFGFGKRTFMVAPARGLSEWIAGPFPGEGLMQVIGWSVAPDGDAARPAVGLAVPDAGFDALCRFVWRSFARDADGRPLLIGAKAESVFYASPHGYALDYTCNRWTAEALAAAGLPVRGQGVVLVADVLRQLAALPTLCAPG